MKWVILVAALSCTATALSLADYPSMFFTPEYNASIILPDTKDRSVTSAGNYLISTLPEYTMRNGRNKTHTTRETVKASITTASQANQSRPSIIIGTPCDNPLVFRAVPTIPCTNALGSDTARIILRDGPQLTITADTSAHIPPAIRYLHENAVQHHGQEIHLTFDNERTYAIIYKSTDTPAYSIRNNNGTTRNDHLVRRRRYGTTIKP